MSDLESYRALYIAESRENHETIVKNLLILENEADEQAIAEIFRAAHSLKGMSASMGFAGMERLCHAMEDIFQEVRSGTLEVHPDLIDLLLAAADDMESLLDEIEGGGEGSPETVDQRIRQLKEWDRRPDKGGAGDAAAIQDIYEQELSDTTQVSGTQEGLHTYLLQVQLKSSCDNKNLRGMIVLSNLDELGKVVATNPSREIIEDGVFDGFFEVSIASDAGKEALEAITSGSEVESVVIIGQEVQKPAPPDAGTETAELRSVQERGEVAVEKGEKTREIRNIRVDIARLDQMMNLVEDLVINRGRITQIARKHQIKELDETLNMVGRSVSDLQNLMMNIRMIPLNHIFNRFPRVVRDVAHREGKEVEFVIEGGETELDRSVMDGLNDPLLHLIRNGIDHGIETPEQRVSEGKQKKGLLRLSARRDKDNVIITVEDDGRGIDTTRVLQKAVHKGLIDPESAATLSREEIFDLLLLPGFSTAEKITDISGRGVGLDVVKNAIESLKGTIKIESEIHRGTKFELLLPPTMAIVNVMMVRINDHRCAIPVNNVVEVASLNNLKIHHIGTQETIMLRNEVLPLDRLDDMFGASRRSEILVVLQYQNRKRSIAVDLIEGQQEVVIKPLSTVIGMCKGVSGVTIPGDGEVVPVLDVNSILKEA
ncbi:two-component system chemotaxis sensor kinase CheA [Methanolinea mesophila]|uniref:chemotaxis protein CheA n=1 Tax=Methanolinea mesophila TaxID=547055 RepID=UPI001AE595C7|nr:chemotaxis protein CheA [Methanolinea mesophila]MBP1927906.1 two-component system chemotaxis sensor kinase CheA [Methanolinea mesophila]